MIFFMSILSFGFCVYLFLRTRYSYWKNRNVPFEEPTFLFGSTGQAITMRTSISNIFTNLYRKYSQYRYVGFFNLWRPAIVIRDPEIVKDILIQNFKSYRSWIQVPDYVDTNLSLNPFVVHGEKWRTIRSNLTSQFTSTKIKSMIPLILNVSEKMTEYIKIQASHKCSTINVKNLALRFTGENVYGCGFGLDGKSFSDEYPEPIRIGDQISSNSLVVQIKQSLSLFFPRITKIIKCTFIGDPVSNVFKNMILASCKFRKDGTIVKKDYLEHLIELKEKKVPYFKTDADLAGHAFTLYLDGFETSASTFTYALFELARNSHIQERAKEEINRVLAKYGSATYNAFQELQYLDNILFETLRKYPIIKFIGRVCLDDVIFPSAYQNVDGESVVIEKGTEVFISLQGLNSDADYYSNPEEFNPDNFSNDSQNSQNMFLGFGNGPRMCLGKSFALAQLKLGLLEILSKFDVEFNEKTKLPLEENNVHLFMSPKYNIWLNFKERL